MSFHLRSADQLVVLLCDRVGCLEHIVSTLTGDHEVQRASLVVSADMFGWRMPADVGDLCPTHAIDLPPIIPRENLCRRSTWCLLAHGHIGKCREAPRGEHAKPDLGPTAPGESWSMSRRRRS